MRCDVMIALQAALLQRLFAAWAPLPPDLYELRLRCDVMVALQAALLQRLFAAWAPLALDLYERSPDRDNI